MPELVFSEEIGEYFKDLAAKNEVCYEVARKARRVGRDPKTEVEVPQAQDLASRVEKLLEDYNVTGVAEQIRRLTDEFGNREIVSLKTAEYMAAHSEGMPPEKALDRAIRVGLAVLTEGILVAPLEGIADTKIKQNPDGTQFVDLIFAGPIRAAGGTAQAMSVLLADVVRHQLGIGEYKPTQGEIDRFLEEIPLYKQCQHIQYSPSNEEIRLIVGNCPIMIDGEGTERVEISGFRDLPRIATNAVRGGACLVVAEGMCLKAAKLQKHVKKLGLQGWDFMDRYLEMKGAAVATNKDEARSVHKSDKYLKDIVAGRPIFGHPGEVGGFRLRYGRATNYREIPSREIPDNLLVMLAMRGPWNALSPVVAEREMAVLKAWAAKLGSKTWLWTYPQGNAAAVPCTAPLAVGRFYQACAPYIFGAYMEAETSVFLFSALNYYVFSRVAWDNKADVKAIVDEYNALMYGPAATEMGQILALTEKQWLTCVGNSVETPAGPVTRFPSEIELWTKFYGTDFIKKIDALFDRAEKRAAKEKEPCARIRFMRREWWGPVKAAREKWLKSVSSKGHWTAVMPEKQWSEPLFLLPMLSRGVMPEAEVRTQVRMKRDAENFYFKFDCEEPRTDAMVTPRRPRDYPRIWEDPTVEVQLDPAGEGKVRYQFIISAAGDVTDIRYVNGLPDLRWNTACKVGSVITPRKGYTVELTIPRKDMEAAVPGKFRANFNRYRALKGVAVQPFYTWSYFVRNFGDLENFGTILFESKEPPQLIRDGDFRSPIRGRFAGPWASTKPLTKDRKTFVFDGESMLLKDEQMLVQFLKKGTLVPGKEYVLSFWVKVSAGMEFNVRFDEGSGYVQMFPRIPVRGPQEWIRQEFRFKVNENFAGKRDAYLRFQPHGKAGSVWLNKVRLYENTAR